MENGNSTASDVLAQMAAAMPDSLKEVIHVEHKSDPYVALLEDERTFAKLWEVFTPEDKKYYALKAGLDRDAFQKLEQDLAAIAGAGDGTKKHFNASAHEDDTDRMIYEPPAGADEKEEAGASVHITGRSPDLAEETEEQARLRRKKYLEALQALDEEEAKRRKETQKDENEANKNSAEKNTAAHEEGKQKVTSSNLSLYRIRDHGDYLTLQGKGDRAPPHGHRAITEQQLRMALIIAILDKGMTDIQIYRGHKIDQHLTSQARGLLAGDPFLQKILGDKAATPILTQMQKDPPYWCKSGLGRWLHVRHYNAQERRNEAATKRSFKDGRKISGNFKDSTGNTLYKKMKQEERAPAAPSSSSVPHA